MSNTKNRLGRGIDSLIPSNDAGTSAGAPTEIDIFLIDNDPAQPRKLFDEEKLAELAASIAVHGIMQPIIVREEGGRYTIIAGERRFRAAKIAGLDKVPVIVRKFDDKEKLEVALIENLQREDLNPMEQAAGINALMETYGLTQFEVSERVGKNRSTIANLLRLLELPEPVANMVRQDKLSASHARSLLPLIKYGTIEQVAKDAAEKRWSVRQAEDYVKKYETAQKSGKAGGDSRRISPELAEVQDTLCGVLETKVRIKGSDSSGQIIIDYYSPDQLEQLYDALCTFTDKLK